MKFENHLNFNYRRDISMEIGITEREDYFVKTTGIKLWLGFCVVLLTAGACLQAEDTKAKTDLAQSNVPKILALAKEKGINFANCSVLPKPSHSRQVLSPACFAFDKFEKMNS